MEHQIRNRFIGFLTILLFFFSLNLQAQEIRINVKDRALNQVLIDIRESYGLKFSFDDEALSKYLISIDRVFSNPDEAITNLISKYDLDWDRVGEVYLIFPVLSAKESVVPETKRIFGVIADKSSGESLPYSHIMVNEDGLISDAFGRFVFDVQDDSAYMIRVSHLGYYRLDTLVNHAGVHDFYLDPSVVGMKEVVVRNQALNLSTMSLQNSGEVRINHQVGSHLPGFADNSLYNLLRLQPGVLAAGEQANDLIIWGSYSGQTGILFDGFTLYGLKNFNDNIGVVNPFMVKDIRLLKGAYPANYGGKAGGIVDITGSSGKNSKPNVLVSATNLILNSKFSIPITERLTLSLAYRKTYYNIYNNETFNDVFRGKGKQSSLVDLSVFPFYSFNDVTSKLSGTTASGDRYTFDFLRGADNYNYLAKYVIGNRDFETYFAERNVQYGGVFNYGKTWKNGNTSDIMFTASSLSHSTDKETTFTTKNMVSHQLTSEEIENRIEEISVQQKNHLRLSDGHALDFGIGIKAFQINLVEDSSGFNLYTDLRQTLALESFLQDNINIGKRLTAKLGMRLDIPFLLSKALVQPRVSFNYRITENSWLKAAWGKYDQYIVQSSILDEVGNYRFFWTISDGDKIPIQTANHFSFGYTYSRNPLSIGFETYYKKMDGLSRYVNRQKLVDENVYLGEGKSIGLDVLVEAAVYRHRVLVGYSLSNTLERFEYFPQPVYVRSPHDQRHELKTALILDFNPFYLSTNYVYGSGLPNRIIGMNRQETANLVYSRWDASATYTFGFGKIKAECGLSVLNLLNTKNIKYQNFVQVSSEMGSAFNILAEAVPFTPTVFLIFEF